MKKQRRIRVFDTKEGEKVLIGEAVFHTWGTDFDEFEQGIGSYSIAIIEFPDGHVESIDVNLIEFIEPLIKPIIKDEPLITEKVNSIVGIVKDMRYNKRINWLLLTISCPECQKPILIDEDNEDFCPLCHKGIENHIIKAWEEYEFLKNSNAVICDSRNGCKRRSECGGAKPHMKDSCEPCPFDKTAKCIEIKSIGK